MDEIRFKHQTKDHFTDLVRNRTVEVNFVRNGWSHVFTATRRFGHDEFDVVMLWCEEQFDEKRGVGITTEDGRWCITPHFGPPQYLIWFRRDADATAFRLRWC